MTIVREAVPGSGIHFAPYTDLANIKQGKNEKLKSYLKKFSEAVAQSETVPPEGMLMALGAGVRTKTKLWKNIRKHQCNDIEDFYQRAETYIRLEETEEPLQELKDNEEEKKDEKNKQSDELLSNSPRREEKRH